MTEKSEIDSEWKQASTKKMLSFSFGWTLVFTVILLRLVKSDTIGIKEIFQHSSTFLKMDDLSFLREYNCFSW